MTHTLSTTNRVQDWRRQERRPLLLRPTMTAVVALLALTTGCATLPKSSPIQDGEAERIRGEFKAMLVDQRQCPPAIDADVMVTIDNLMWSGTLTGYLKAMAPAYLRFEGVNPLGLTEAIFAVDGKNFTYLSVRNQQAYSGPLNAELLSRYAPDGLATGMSYYWLLGRIPPGSVGITRVGLDQDGHGYWLDLQYTTTGDQAMILFDPGQHLVRRHLILNEHEAIAAELAYEYQPATAKAPCLMPDKVTISSLGNGHMNLAVTKRYPTPPLDSAPVQVTPPAEYTRNVVQ